MRRPTKWRSFLLALVLGPILAGHAFAITLDDHVVTADPLAASGCTTPVAKTSFSPSDELVYVWLLVGGVSVGDTVEWRWFAPGDSPYTTGQYTFDFAGAGCAWSGINIEGQAPATLPGEWRVDVYLNGTFATAAAFTIEGAPPGPTVGAGAAHLAFAVNDPHMVPWGYIHLSYLIQSFQPGRHADLHLALLLQDDAQQCLAPESVFASGLPAVATNLALANTQAVIVARHLPADLRPSVATLLGVLVAPGTSPADPTNWISNLAELDLAVGSLSSRQKDVIAAQGNPQAFLIDFDRDRNLRSEIWIYQRGGSGHEFHFINGGVVGSPQEGERAGGAPGGATRYDPGRFSPATSPADIRALLGDPDHVVHGAVPGRIAWIFDGARMTVTLTNGVITRIEVY